MKIKIKLMAIIACLPFYMGACVMMINGPSSTTIEEAQNYLLMRGTESLAAHHF